ncbi:MAG: hypothetical protein WEB06_05390 [Actinomycetota bacterium]
MSLRLLRTELGPRAATWSIETPTPGVVLIDVTIEGQTASAPLHWRAGTWSKPPLDLTLDDQGRLVALQFVLQDERVAAGQWTVFPDFDEGLPVFDIAGWPSERYRDETVPVEASRLSGGELALRLGDPQPLGRACGVGSALVMGFTDASTLAEIRLGPLDQDDWAAINAFSYVE